MKFGPVFTEENNRQGLELGAFDPDEQDNELGAGYHYEYDFNIFEKEHRNEKGQEEQEEEEK
jgi:hypothetical protein